MIERTSGQPIQRHRKTDDVPLADVLSHYITEQIDIEAADDKSCRKPLSRPQEVLTYILHLIDWWGDKTVGDITRANCRTYTGTCKTPTAARNRLEYLRRALNIALEDRIIDRVVVVTLPPKPKRRTDFFERDDVAKMIRACRAQRLYTHNEKKSENTGHAGTQVRTTSYPRRHLIPYILLATYTGTRSSRMFTASFIKKEGRPWIDLERGVYHRTAPGEEVAKNKQAPSFKIPKRLLQYMRRWYKAGRRYPIEFNGEPIENSRALSRLIKELFPDRKLVPHSFRHTAATWMMRESELAINDIAGFLGMSMEMLDRVYGHHRTHHQQGIADAISTGGIGKIKKDKGDTDNFSYGKKQPEETGRNKSEQAKPSQIKMSVRSQKIRKAA
ncbi:tyrosine-type recombinase/integrase [Rhizobium sp. 2YAF20]|uniref:tyrosine-type recombinase/integrase n=1 Tax=Rhizobium sp. 2YAF20 TaxID=3233027 RepID=UPI003F9B6C32